MPSKNPYSNHAPGDDVPDWNRVSTPPSTVDFVPKHARERPPRPVRTHTVPKPAKPLVEHKWPVIQSDLPDGTLVRFDRVTVGHVQDGQVVIQSGGGFIETTADRARRMIQQGVLTGLTSEGELQ